MRQDQWDIYRHPAKVKVLSMGRRWGKSVLGQIISVLTANAGGRVAWCVPNYKNGNPLWRGVRQAVGELVAQRLCSVNNTERTVEFQNGGGIALYSMDNPDSIRGEAFHIAILDEAAMMPEGVWTEVIQPTLADNGGDAILISTPKGRNWFWREWQHGRDGMEDYASWTAPSSANPNPNIKRAAELARFRVPEQSYRQEWLAEFLEDGGNVFRRVRDAVENVDPTPTVGHDYVIGVDWGKQHDFTVVTVLDTFLNSVVTVDRFNQIDYSVQMGRVQRLVDKYRPVSVIVERNSMGEVLVEQAERRGWPVEAFTTTAASKRRAIDDLALAFEQGAIQIPDEAWLIDELEAYDMERLPSGMLRYGAPAGMHDDGVMSLAIAWHGATAGMQMDADAANLLTGFTGL